MLISFAVTNCLSFRGRTELNMLAVESDDSLPNNVKDVPTKRSRGTKKVRLLKSAAIYGPNASGKSNLLITLRRVFDFIRNSCDLNSGPIHIPFLLDPSKRAEPSECEIKLLLDGIIYRYGFTILEDKVHEEWLFSAEKGPERLVFVREWQEDIKNYNYTFGPTGKKQFKNLVGHVRPDALLLSVGRSFNAPDAMAIFSFRMYLQVQDEREWQRALNDILTFPGENKQLKPETELEILTALLRFADIGLDKLELITVGRDKLFDDSPPGDPGGELAKEQIGSNKAHDIEFIYTDCDKNQISIPRTYQSTGTKYLLHFFLIVLRHYKLGRLFICDELEKSLHPMLCEALLRFFHSLPNNNSQLIFTTHNTGLLNADVLRRDQVWIMEKYPNGQSCAVSLSDFKGVRKGAKLGKHYLEGMFGGLPLLDEHILRNILKALAEDDQGA